MGDNYMKQKFFLHIEKGVAQYDNLQQAMRVKDILNSKGISARVRMSTPYNKKGKSIKGLH